MKKINDIEVRNAFESRNEKMWFSLVAQLVEEAQFGKIDLTFTVKGGKVVNIKRKTEGNYNIGAS